MVFAGAAAGKWLYDSTKQAIEFERSIALVATQTDKVKVSQKELGDIVKDTAGKIAIPIEQLSAGLYDIFSSLSVTVPQSRHLLEEFAKEAVAGQVDLQTASRATIGILNAFHIPAENVNKVLDVQFQLVRKGVGTFEQFAGAIGKATPSAARAGQSIESLAGMLAYLTRNGLSADMAAASAARALDALAHPKTIQRLEKMGVVTKDAKGQFRDIGGIMLDLQGKLANLTAPERAAALQELFKSSGGTIQARRFYDAVLKDRDSVMQFLGLVGDMQNAQGAFTDAYSTMADTTAAKSQLLKNRWQIMRIEVGQALIPVFNKLLDVLGRVLDWWNKLDDGTKFLIIKIIAMSAVLSSLLGIVTSVAGAFVMLSGAASLVGLSLGALLGIFALVVVGIGLLVAAGYLIYKNWDKIIKALGEAWNWLLNSVLKPVWDWIVRNFGERLVALWNRISNDVITAVKTMGNWIKRIWDDIVNWTQGLWDDVMKIIQPLVDGIVDAWEHVKNILIPILNMILSVFEGTWTAIVGVLKGAWEAISGVVEGIIKVFQGIIDIIVGVFSGDWERAWRGIGKIFAGVWKAIWGVLTGVWDAIVGLIKGAWHILADIVKQGFHILVEAFQAVWDIILGALEAVWDAIVKLFWDLPGQILKALWESVTGIFTWAYDVGSAVIDYFATGSTAKMEAVAGVGKQMAEKYAGGVLGGKGAVVQSGQDIIDAVIRVFGGAPEPALNEGKIITRSLADGLTSEQQNALNRVTTIVGLMHDLFHSRDADFDAAGQNIGRRFNGGLSAQSKAIVDVVNAIVGAVHRVFSGDDAKYEAAGRRVAASFGDGIGSKYQAILDVANRVAGGLHALFGGVSLRSEGAAIVESLKSGAESKIGALGKIFQTITAMIPTWKGPMDLDKKLLTPSGVAIMQGLIRGVESQRDSLRSTMFDVTNDITSGMRGDYSMRSTASNPLPYTYMPVGSNGSGSGVTQSITINTPEIVPERDAAILGFALSGRVG
jgi:TP901 family phage tail tape measure protein